MSDVNLSAIDLNLLVVLDAVLEEGSATRAAARLHITQSAVSNALRRARELFGDELVVRRPYGLAPTSRALAIAPTLRGVLDGARSVLAGAPAFDPATTTRCFTIACSDAIGVTVLPALLRRMRVHAPRARIRMITIERMVATDGLARGEVDLLVGIPPVLASAWRAEPVYNDPMSCIVRKGHPTIGKSLTLARYASASHVEVALFGEPDDLVDRALAKHGRTRTVAIAVPHFTSVPLAVLETECIATLSTRIARAFAARMPLVVLRPPVRLPRLAVQQIWHQRNDDDPAIAFLRAQVKAAARDARPRS